MKNNIFLKKNYIFGALIYLNNPKFLKTWKTAKITVFHVVIS